MSDPSAFATSPQRSLIWRASQCLLHSQSSLSWETQEGRACSPRLTWITWHPRSDMLNMAESNSCPSSSNSPSQSVRLLKCLSQPTYHSCHSVLKGNDEGDMIARDILKVVALKWQIIHVNQGFRRRIRIESDVAFASQVGLEVHACREDWLRCLVVPLH